VHGASISSGDNDGSDESRADLNSMIDDYAASGNAVLRVALAGKQQDGFFSPMRRVSPISLRVKEPTPADPAPKAQSAEPDAKKDPNLPQILPSPPAVTSDLAKNAAPTGEPTTAGEKGSPDYTIPKFRIDDTFNSEDPVN
jgi:hypothetical protein